MKILRPFLVVVFFLYFVFSFRVLFAAEYNFMISPPPIPWFEFQQDQFDMRVGGTYFNMSGDIVTDTTPPTEEKIKINGGAGNLIARYAFHEQFAVDGGIGIFGGSGSIGTADLGMAGFSIPVDLEFQAVKTDAVSLILFGGLNYSFFWTGVWWTSSMGTDYEIHAYANQVGPQVGAQLSFKTNSMAIAPFILWQRLSGSASVDVYVDGAATSDSVDIPATSFVFYGLDIVFIPLNITLSTVLQQIMASGDNKGINTILISLNYDFQFGGPEQE